MKIIVGLGNPGKQYEGTRHNAGFLALDRMISSPSLNSSGEVLSFNLDKRLKARVLFTVHKGEKVILVKPDTFMNASGIAVKNVMSYYKAELADLIVVSDDKDLPLGEARIRLQGGSAGQKGLQNIIDELGSDNFVRLRIGINNSLMETIIQDERNQMDTADFVLQKFSDRELPVLENVIEEAANMIISCIDSKDEFQSTSIKI